MFGTLGGPELVLILVVALIVFGPRKLPDIGKSLGRMMAEFRKASNEFRRTIEDEVEAEKPRPPEQLPPPAMDVPSAPPTAAEPHAEPGVPPEMSPEVPPGPPADPTVNREVSVPAADPK
jgi:TatA/E family protein of Tat protein translocase